VLKPLAWRSNIHPHCNSGQRASIRSSKLRKKTASFFFEMVYGIINVAHRYALSGNVHGHHIFFSECCLPLFTASMMVGRPKASRRMLIRRHKPTRCCFRTCCMGGEMVPLGGGFLPIPVQQIILFVMYSATRRQPEETKVSTYDC